MQGKNRKKLRKISSQVFSSAVLIQLASGAALAHDHHGGPGPAGGNNHGLSTNGGGQSTILDLGRGHAAHSGKASLPTNASAARVHQPSSFDSHFGLSLTSLPLSANNSARSLKPVVASIKPNNTIVSNSSVTSIELDLTSTSNSISLEPGVIRHGSAVTINVGGTNTTYKVGDKVTAAELVAIQQAQSAGGQTIEVDSQGRASGGSFSLNRATSSDSLSVSAVTVAQNVVASDVINGRHDVNLAGDLVNYGSISEVVHGSRSSANLSANNIVNQAGALITTVNHGGNKGVADLSLSATNDVTNYGTIESSGSLSITAGGSLHNGGAGSVTAANDVSINANKVSNSGTIASTFGNVNLNGSANDFTVSNAGGTISAAKGSINVNYNGVGAGTVTGGDLVSNQLNLNSGAGTVNVNVDELTGTVVSTGNAAHVQANTDLLKIGTQTLTGDPTYFNSLGGIQITGDIDVFENLTIIAKGDITATAGLTHISTNNTGGAGDIVIVAGANVTSVLGGNTETNTIALTPPQVGNATGNVTFSGASGTGGNVDLSGANPALLINTSTTTGFGRDVTLAAYSNAGKGQVILPAGSTIDTTTTDVGFASGRVLVFAPNGITIGGANANFVQLIGAQPKTFVSGSAGPIVFLPDGSVLSNQMQISADPSLVQSGSIQTNGPINGGLFANSGGTVTLNGSVTSAPGASVISITAKDTISFAGNLSAYGVTLLSGHDVTATIPGSTISADAPVGNPAANVLVVAGANFSLTGGFSAPVTSGPGSGGGTLTGGAINFNNVSLISAKGFPVGSSGGQVTLVAFNGNDNTGSVNLNSTQIATGGNSGAANGNVTVVAGGTIGNAIDLTSGFLNLTNGLANTGNVILSASTPNLPVTVDIFSGTVQSGQFQNGALTTGQIQFGSGLLRAASNVSIVSNGDVSTPNSFTGSSINNFVVQGNTVSLGQVTNVNNVQASALSTAGIFGITASQSISITAIGPIQINGDLVVGSGALANKGISLVSSSDIFTNFPGLQISTSGPGNSGNLTMVAGATFTESASNIQITGGSATGGIIDFAFNQILVITTTGAAGGTGGNVSMVAFADGSGQRGSIKLGTVTINTGGNGAGANGNVVLVAANNFGQNALGTVANPINVDTSGGAGGTGNITFSVSTPSTPVQITKSNASTSGSFLDGALTNGNVFLGTVTSSALVTVKLGNTFTLNAPLSSGSVFVESGNDINVTAPIAVSGKISLLSDGSINIGGNMTAPGGLLLVSEQNIITTAGGITLSTSAVGSSGPLNIIAGASFSETGNVVTISGGSATGGVIDFGTNGIAQLDASSPNGAGGKVTLVAFADNSGLLGTVDVGTAGPAINSGGNSGANGDVVIVAGSNTGLNSIGSPTHPISINATGGTALSGNITLSATTPNTAVPVQIDIITQSYTAGNFLGGALVNGNAVRGATNAGRTLSILQGSTVTLSDPLSAVNLIVESAGDINENLSLTSTKSVALLSFGTIVLNSDITPSDGLLLVAGQDISTATAGINLNTGVGTGIPANIAIIAGAAFTFSGGNVSITGGSATGGRVDFASNAISSLSTSDASGGAGSINIAAFAGSNNTGDVLTPSGSTIQTNGSLAGNGSVTIVAGRTAGTAINIGSIDSSGGTSGSSTIDLSTSTPNATALNPFVLKAGPNAGSVTAGSLVGGTTQTADILGADITATGGFVTVTSGRNVVLNQVDVTGAAGGAFTLVEKGTTALQIGTLAGSNRIDSITADGTVNAAGHISITESGNQGITTLTAFSLDSGFGAGGDLLLDAGTGVLSLFGNSVTAIGASGGGTIKFVADSINWTLQGGSALTLDTSGVGGTSGGSVDITLSGSSPLAIGTQAGALNLISQGGNGSVKVTAVSSSLTVDGSGIDVSASTNANGGTILLSGASVSTPVGTNSVLDASGFGTGVGGTIGITSTQLAPLVIGNVAGGFSLVAQSGLTSGSGGSVSVSTGADLTVDAAAIGAGPQGAGDGNGASIFLRAGQVASGNLAITGALNGNGRGTTGTGGAITLQSNSATPFILGGKKFSINSSAVPALGGSAGNGSLTVVNLAGGITQSGSVLAVKNVSYTAGGASGAITISSALGDSNTASVLLTATGSGALTSAKTITANVVGLTSGATGVIGGKKALSVFAGAVSANGGGAISVADSNTAAVAIGPSGSTGASFSFTSAGSIVTTGAISAATDVTIASTAKKTDGSIILTDNVIANLLTGTATITATNAGTITDFAAGADSIQANTVELSSKSGAMGAGGPQPLRVLTSNLSALTSGDVTIVNLNNAASGVHLIGGSSASPNSFTLHSNDSIFADATLKSAFQIDLSTIANNGNITINASQGGKSTTAMVLSCDGSGNITQTSTKLKLTGNVIQMFSGSGNIGTAAINMIDVSSVMVFNTGTAGVVNATSAAKGAVLLADSSAGTVGGGGAFVLTAGKGGLNFANITSDSISITTSGGLLQTLGGTLLGGTGIVINNTSTKGSINIGANTFMSTTGGFITPGSGEIDIVVGTLPPSKVAGPNPGNVNINGNVFFNVGITTVGPTVNNLSGVNTDLVFSAPTAAQITLGDGVNITADPPLPFTSSTSTSNLPIPQSPGTNLSLPGSSLASLSMNPTMANATAIVPFDSNPSTINSGIASTSAFGNLAVAMLTAQSATDGKFDSFENVAQREAFLQSSEGWISETELETGEIPASILSEHDLGLGTDRVSTAVSADTRGSVMGSAHNAVLPKVTELTQGSLVSASSQDSTIRTRFGDVSIAANAMVVVMAFKHGIAVYDLDDNHAKSVSIDVNGKTISLHPGRSVVVASDAVRSFDEINPAQLVAYRNLREHNHVAGAKVYSAEFSPLTMVNAVTPLKTLLKSKHPHAVSMSNHFLKTTSIMMQLQGGGSAFQQILKPATTAYVR